jgi:hypothetical protein
MDFYRLLAPFTLASVAGILACMVFRHFFKVGNPVLGVAACSGLIAAANLAVLSLTPSGRAVLGDIKHSFLLLRPVKAALEVQ